MIRPKRERPTASSFNKFVRIFGLLMTTLYVGGGIFLIFADAETMNLSIPNNTRYLLGGILILYGIVRFVRVYQANSRKNNNRYEE